MTRLYWCSFKKNTLAKSFLVYQRRGCWQKKKKKKIGIRKKTNTKRIKRISGDNPGYSRCLGRGPCWSSRGSRSGTSAGSTVCNKGSTAAQWKHANQRLQFEFPHPIICLTQILKSLKAKFIKLSHFLKVRNCRRDDTRTFN